MLEQWNRKKVLNRQKKIYHRKKKKAEQIKYLWGFLFKCCIIAVIEDCYEEVRDMLSIYLGDMPEAIYHPPIYFDNTYEDEWITNELSVEMIADVDKSKVIGAHLIESPVLGPIPPQMLSGGVKTLMVLAFDESGKIFNAVGGDNCAKWILKIAEKKDLTINLRHIMNFGEEPFEAKILNTGETVHNMLELIRIAGTYV